MHICIHISQAPWSLWQRLHPLWVNSRICKPYFTIHRISFSPSELWRIPSLRWWCTKHVGVSNKKVVPPIRFSIINHPFWGTTIFGNTHMCILRVLPSFRWGSWTMVHHWCLRGSCFMGPLSAAVGATLTSALVCHLGSSWRTGEQLVEFVYRSTPSVPNKLRQLDLKKQMQKTKRISTPQFMQGFVEPRQHCRFWSLWSWCLNKPNLK